MTATPARIGFVIEPYRRATSETPAVAARHGHLARETADPLETYFSTIADAQVRADERQALLSADRQVFDIPIYDVDLVLDLLDSEEILTVRLIDEERGLSRPMLLTELQVDTAGQTASAKVWG